MTNNDILRRVRYLFDYEDAEMIAIFKSAGLEVHRADVCDWLRPEEEESFMELSDSELSVFLNGFIIKKRGKREGPLPEPEKILTNNLVLKKMKIALSLKTEEVVDIFAAIDKKISKHELGAFFRHPENKSYEPCLDQYLRNFFNGLQAKKKSLEK